MTKPLEEKVALVTGAASGIGRASSILFAKDGAKVVAADIDEKKGQETVLLIQKNGGEAVFVKADVTDARDVESLVRKVIGTYGRLDYAHNNAGVECPKATVVECLEEDWDKTMEVNLKGPWLCMKYEIPEMLKTGKGAIVNTASALAFKGASKYAPYAVSKHGVVGLTRSAALEFIKQNIRINCVCPGIISTGMTERVVADSLHFTESTPDILEKVQMFFTQLALNRKQPSGRMGLAEEVAAAVVWLCSDAASYINGHSLVIDGGFLAK